MNNSWGTITAVLAAVVLLAGCGGTGSDVVDYANYDGPTTNIYIHAVAETSSNVFELEDILDDVVKDAEDSGDGTVSGTVDSLDDNVTVTCKFVLGGSTTTPNGIVAISTSACSAASGDNVDNCIYCNLSSEAVNATADCTGVVPSTAAAAAESIPLSLECYTLFQTDMEATGYGGVKIVGSITDWSEMNPSAGAVSNDETACDSANTDQFSLQNGTTESSTTTGYHYFWEVGAKNGTDDDGDGLKDCQVDTAMSGGIALTGVDTPGASLDMARSVLVISSICDVKADCQ